MFFQQNQCEWRWWSPAFQEVPDREDCMAHSDAAASPHRCNTACMPRHLVEEVCSYVSSLTSDNCTDLTIIFPESGSACTELAVAAQLIHHSSAVCNGIVLMDALYADPMYADHIICKESTLLSDNYNGAREGVQIKQTVCCSYDALADVIDTLPGVVVIIGIHQRTLISTDSGRDDHLRYLRQCEEGHIHGKVLTPYLNFMYCGDVATLIAVARHGQFNVLPACNGLLYVLDVPWRDRVDRFDSPQGRSMTLTQTHTLEENTDPSN